MCWGQAAFGFVRMCEDVCATMSKPITLRLQMHNPEVFSGSVPPPEHTIAAC